VRPQKLIAPFINGSGFARTNPPLWHSTNAALHRPGCGRQRLRGARSYPGGAAVSSC
jgi:hypothetical protein